MRAASMRAMFRAAPPEPARPAIPTHAAARQWPAWLLWGGAIACVAGLAGHGLFEHWVRSRTISLLVIALLALGVAWVLRRVAGLALAHGLAIAWLLALAWMGGPLPMLATLVAAAAAGAVGGLILPRPAAATRMPWTQHSTRSRAGSPST